MHATTLSPTTDTDAAGAAGPADLRARLTGIAGLTFAGVVLAQNVVRGGSVPANDATADEVLTYYADHKSLTALGAVTFAIAGTALTVFLGGAVRRMLAGSRPGWAYTGLAGAVGVMGLFSVVMGAEFALSVVANGDAPELGAVQALWALHNGVFSVLFLSLAVALLGLSRAGVAAGITPRPFETLGLIGAGLLAVAAAFGPAIAAGDAMPVFGMGSLGFLTWLAFLAATGVRLVRSS